MMYNNYSDSSLYGHIFLQININHLPVSVSHLPADREHRPVRKADLFADTHKSIHTENMDQLDKGSCRHLLEHTITHREYRPVRKGDILADTFKSIATENIEQLEKRIFKYAPIRASLKRTYHQ